MKFLKNRKIIKELIARRDEVTRRAVKIANRNIPQNLIDMSYPKIIEWVVSPHLYEVYKKASNVEESVLRDDMSLVYKILGVFKDKNKKNKVNKDDDKYTETRTD